MFMAEKKQTSPTQCITSQLITYVGERFQDNCLLKLKVLKVLRHISNCVRHICKPVSYGLVQTLFEIFMVSI